MASGKPEFFLKYPQDLGVHAQVTYEQASNMLVKAAQLAATNPFVWSYIDKPRDGSVFVVFLVPQHPQFPNDGIVYQDNETRGSVPAGFGREMEISELKNGFVPGEDTSAYRVRRRYRLTKGGHPQLNLLHYTRGHPMAILGSLAGRPARSYPLRPINELPVIVLGERAGQKVPPAGMRAPVPGQPGYASQPGVGSMGGPMGMHPGQQAAMLATQSRSMDAVDGRHLRERQAGAAAAAAAAQAQMFEDDSGDEYDHVSTRTLALARFKRNHDYMHEVFMFAGFGDKIPRDTRDPYSCFDEDEIKGKVSKLKAEIEELKAKAENRQRTQQRPMMGDDTLGDVSMESLGSAPVEASA